MRKGNTRCWRERDFYRGKHVTPFSTPTEMSFLRCMRQEEGIISVILLGASMLDMYLLKKMYYMSLMRIE